MHAGHRAQGVRQALPLAAEIVLSYSDQGSFLVPAGRYLAADGTRLTVPGGHGTDELDDAIMPFCTYLSDDSEGAWMPFISSVAPGGSCCLKIDDILAAFQAAPDGRPPTECGGRQPRCRTAVLAITLAVELCTGGEADEARRAVRDHLRVTSTNDAVLHVLDHVVAIRDSGQAGG